MPYWSLSFSGSTRGGSNSDGGASTSNGSRLSPSASPYEASPGTSSRSRRVCETSSRLTGWEISAGSRPGTATAMGTCTRALYRNRPWYSGRRGDSRRLSP